MGNVPTSNELDSLSGATTYNEYISKTKNTKFIMQIFYFNLLPTYNKKSYLPFYNLLPTLFHFSFLIISKKFLKSYLHILLYYRFIVTI